MERKSRSWWNDEEELPDWAEESTMKVILLGNTNVGKSCLMTRYITNTYDPLIPETIGAAFCDRKVTVRKRTIKLHIWDTAGDERYRSVVRLYYRGAKAALVCYDLTNRKSWDDVTYWIEELVDKEEGCQIYLVGTKSDLLIGDQPCSRVVSEREIRSFIESQQYAFINQSYETSSRTGYGVEKLFSDVAESYVLNLPSSDTDRPPIVLHQKTDIKCERKDGKCSC